MTKNIFIKIMPAAMLFMLLSITGNAQLVSCNAFLQGKYIEVGVNSLGSYGSSVAAPAGYHPRGGTGVYNTCTGLTGPSSTNLGFVADPDKDGWTIGTPNYIGDYFLPGTPYEGWIIEVNGSRTAQNNGASTSLGSITSVTNSGQIRSATWVGSYAGLSIKQVTSFDTANLFFTCKVTLKNTTSGTLSNVYYLRGVDPDNEQPLTGNFTTNNAIAYQLPNSANATLVTGSGQTYGAYLGLGTLDLRAKCYITPSWPPSGALSSVYAGASGFTYLGISNGDYGIGIVFNMGNIAAGDSTSFVFTYILKGSDFLAALLATTSGWAVTGDTSFSHKSGDTAYICQYANTTVSVSNPGITSWSWTALTGETLSSSTGSSVSLTTGNTFIRLMAIGTGSGPSDTVYVNLNPVFTTPSTPTAGSNSPICQNTALNLSSSGGGTVTYYKWSGPGGYSSTIQNPTISNAQLTAAGIYTVNAVNGSCSSPGATTTVVVNAAPTISAGSSATICNGSSTALTATGGVTYTWAPAGSLSASTGASVTASPTVTTVYTVTGTNSAGCSGTATKTVFVNPNPGAITGTLSACPGTTTTLTNAVSGGTWSSSATSMATVGSTTGIVTGIASGTSTISYTLTNGCGTATATVTVNTPPSVAGITGNTSVFAGYTTALSDATSGGTWSSSNAAVATVNSSGVVTGVGFGTSLITYSVTGTCVARAFATVNVLACGVNGATVFSYTGSNQTWTVPAGITSVTVTATGAGGGSGYYDASYGNHPGRGGRVVTVLAVTPGQVLNLFVGKKGDNNTLSSTILAYGGYNGGGNASPSYGYYSGGGGGASDVRIGGTALSDRVIVAGGGGGQGYGYLAGTNGGDGGNTTGGTGGIYVTTGMTAATGGSQTAGGTGGVYGTNGANYAGTAGSFGQGGTGAYYYGGGGGGGYYGGGGGAYLSSGGGGSSYAGSGTSSVTYTQGVNPSDGEIQLSFPQSNVVISSNPSNTTACSGTTASFSVGASISIAPGTLNYQWQVNTGSGYADISGATNSTYSFTASTGDGGNQYRVVVSSVCDQSATSGEATLTVIGTPEITVCPSDVAASNDAGNCSAVVSYTAATVTGSSPTITYSHASGSTFNVGNTVVTVNATNSCGSAYCNFNVTVTDDEAPTITAPSNVAVNNTTGDCSATVSLGTPTTGDNCDVASVTNDHSSSTYTVGTTTVTWTVTDIHGNSSTATQTVTVNDIEAPVAVCQNYTLNLSGGTGTVTASNIDNGSSDNCGIASMSVSPNTFTCANAGANTVTLTVTDVHGNTSTCTATVTVQYQPSCSISVTPSSSTYTGGNPNTIYLGYGPQSATLTATGTGGSGFSYSWTPGTGLSCTNCQSPVFTPTAAGTYNYTVTVTNSNGCSSTCVVSLCVIDARDPVHEGKVIICHVPPGNPSNPQTLSISESAVPSHLSNHAGDRVGPCSSSCGTAGKGGVKAADIYEASSFSLVVYPNPFSNEINVDIEGQENIPAQVVLYDMTGRIMQYLPNQSIGKSIMVGKDLPAGMYILEVKQNESSKRVKVTKL